jgi:hypothetical protein
LSASDYREDRSRIKPECSRYRYFLSSSGC